MRHVWQSFQICRELDTLRPSPATGHVGGEKFKRYSRLDRLYANLQGELQYGKSGQFSEPIWGVFVRPGEDWYDSTLRDGYRTSAGLSVRKPVTDKLFFIQRRCL